MINSSNLPATNHRCTLQSYSWNAATSLLPLLLLTYVSSSTSANGAGASYKYLYMSSLWTFCGLAAWNHVQPNAATTQMVKVAFVPVALWSAPIWLSGSCFILTLLPALPHSRNNKKTSSLIISLSEVVGGAIRQGWMGYVMISGVFWTFTIPWWILISMLFCKVVYGFERRDRIQRNQREQYGLWHAVEHVDVALYVMVTLPSIQAGGEDYYLCASSSLLLSLVSIAEICWRGDILTSKATLFDFHGTCIFLWVNFHKPLYLVAWIVLLMVKIPPQKDPTKGTMSLRFQHLVAACITLYAFATTTCPWSSHRSLESSLEEAIVSILAFATMIFAMFGSKSPIELMRCVIAVTNAIAYYDPTIGDEWHWEACVWSKRTFTYCSLMEGLLWWAYSRSLWWSHKDDPLVPPELNNLWHTKLFGNCFSNNLAGYITKPSNPCLTLESWTLTDLYLMCKEKRVGERFLLDSKTKQPRVDLIVGLTTGGAFVANAILASAEVLDSNDDHATEKQDDTGVVELAYLQSRSWSGMGVCENVWLIISHWMLEQDSFLKTPPKVLQWYQGRAPKLIPTVSCPCPYRRILLVDDTVTTGRTMIHSRRFLQQEFPGATIETLVWRAPKEDSAIALDHVLEYGEVPLLCPWGFEND